MDAPQFCFLDCPLDILLKRVDKSKIPNAPTPDYGTLTGRIPMPFQWLRFWSNSKARQKLSHVTFLMYTRKGCHLCEIAWKILRSAQKDHGFVLKAEDVDTDPNLAELYGQIVPVVLLNGQVRFRGGINNVLLQRLLKAEIAKSAIQQE